MSRAGWGQSTENTVRKTTSRVLTSGDCCVEVVERYRFTFSVLFLHIDLTTISLGHGECVLGECVCKNEWTGDSCECPASTSTCQSPDSLVCSGHGKCVCGKCVCSDSRRSGSFCERCPACQSTCQSNMSVCIYCR